jgi:phospho-N-acetylmuramoyl-pentapeptide-transferase
MSAYAEPLKIFNVIQYVTARTAYASLTALLISLLLGPYLIRRLQEISDRPAHPRRGTEVASEEGRNTDDGRRLDCRLHHRAHVALGKSSESVCMAVDPLFADVWRHRFADDYLKIRHKRNLGLTARQKILLQFLVGALIGVVLLYLSKRHIYSTTLTVPFAKFLHPDLVIDRLLSGPWFLLGYLPFLVFVSILIVGSSNAVNLTDGLDGLAIGCTLIASTAFTALTYISGHKNLSQYLDIQNIAGVSEVTIFCGSMVGASLGFLWYNAHPAEVFMGDVGSLALGARSEPYPSSSNRNCCCPWSAACLWSRPCR